MFLCLDMAARVYRQVGNYERAQEIVDNFSTSESYIRNLVANVTGDEDFATDADYRNVLSEAYKIRGLARAVLKSRDQKLVRQGLVSKVKTEPRTNITNTRQKKLEKKNSEYTQLEFRF